ncbi:MAG: DUF2868 domain-containing protein [SAR324 cluster bacterium]|nr:DUF2868 domain-containing protein [SAR324 cluster bacterium]
MTLDAIQKLLLIQSLEICDSSGLLLSSENRRQATLQSGIQPEESKLKRLESSQIEFLHQRANRLHAFLSNESLFKTISLPPAVPRAKGLGILIIVIAFILGLFSNQLGNDQFINLVAFPLLGLYLWNLIIYVLFLGKWLRHKLHPMPENHYFFGLLPHLLYQVHQLFQHRKLRHPHLTPVENKEQLAFQIRSHFLMKWIKLTAPIQLCQITFLLHLGASVMAMGVIGGMYFNGISFEYKASWQSTFLTPAALQQGLEILLGPASMLSNIGIPPGQPLEALRRPDATGENAALWIHLFTITTFLYIVLPRILLSSFSYQQLRSIQNSVQLPEDILPYYQETALQLKDSQSIVVIPYAIPLEINNRELLRKLLCRLWARAAKTEFQDPIPYGEETSFFELSANPSSHVVLLLDFNATPEKDAHGRVVQEIKQQLMESSADNPFLILLDCHRFEKIRELPEFEKRFQERKNAWETMFCDMNLPCFIFDNIHTTDMNEHLKQARNAVWTNSR